MTHTFDFETNVAELSDSEIDQVSGSSADFAWGVLEGAIIVALLVA